MANFNYKTEQIILREELNGPYSFEMKNTEVSIILDDCGKRYLRVYKRTCAAENNGRPITTISDYCCPIDPSDCVTAENWKKISTIHIEDRMELEYKSYCGV